jgi:Ca2+/H+ antiporter
VSYLIDSQFFANSGSQNMRSMLFFIGVITLLLSIPTMVWNYSMMKNSIKNKEKVGFVLAIIVCALAVFLFITWYVTGIHKVGATVI